tara:strand:+ start:255 stop:2486 length:2232 start_codon:yes stop_codon:yes gene_type:complete
MSDSEYTQARLKAEGMKRKRDEYDTVSKFKKSGKAAPRRLFSSRTKSWHEMCRSLTREDDHRKELETLTHGSLMVGRFDLCRLLMMALIGPGIPSVYAKMSSKPAPELYTCPKNSTDSLKRLYELLVHAIQSRDPHLVTMVFFAIRENQTTVEQSDAPVSDTLAKRLMETPAHASETLAFLMLSVRRPRLVRWFLKTDLVAEHARNNHLRNLEFRNELSAMAAAINDCVFSPHREYTYEESKSKWTQRHTPYIGRHTTDLTCSAKGWREVLTDIMTLVGDKLPERIYEDTKLGTGRANRFVPVSLLVVGIRSFEIDDTFLKQALHHKKWSESQLFEAVTAALSSEEGVRGPSFVDALVVLYRELVDRWKTNENTLKRGVACTEDTIAGTWRLLADKTSGYENVEVGGDKGRDIIQMPVAGARAHLLKKPPDHEDVLMRHPTEWELLFENMIRCHTPNPEDDNSHLWDTGSPFFASLVHQAIRRVMSDSKRTRLLGFLMKATDGCALVGDMPDHGVETVYESRKLWSWLAHPKLIGQVCLHHVSLLPHIIEKMCSKPAKNSKAPPPPLPEFVEDLHLGLWLSVTNTKRQAARLLIAALKVGNNMPQIAEAGSWGGEADCSISWLSFYVKELCGGADQASRDAQGEDFADFLNARVSADFKAVVASAEWSTDALDEALRFASRFNRPIAAAVLMSAPSMCIPDANDAFLMAINSEIYAPGSIATEATASNFATLVATTSSLNPAA